MKRVYSLLFALALCCALAACGAGGGQDGGASSPPPANGTSSAGTPGPAPEPTPPAEGGLSAEGETNAEDGKILVAYFSWSGNTETLAGMIQAETGGDFFAIETETPYTDDYNALLEVAHEEQSNNARPAWPLQWRTGRTTAPFSWAIPTGGAAPPCRSSAFWSPMTVPA